MNAAALSSFWAMRSLRLEKTQQKHRSDYQRYLGAKPLAEERGSREIELSAATRTRGACHDGVEGLRERPSRS